MRLSIGALCAALVAGAALAAHAATVTGTVTSAATGNPLNGMVVAAYDTAGILQGTAGSDATGLYVLTLAAGDYRLLAYDPAGIHATAFDANAESFETSPVRSISSSAEVGFALVKGGFVAGRVQTTIGMAIAEAVVEAYNLSGTRRGFTTTNTSGDYTLVLPPGDYKIVAYDASGAYAVMFHSGVRSFDEATPLGVSEAVTTNLTFTLSAAARVSGTAIDAVTRMPLASILVYAYTSSGALVSQTPTSATGAFQLSIPAGDYRFVAADASRAYATSYYDGSLSFEGGRVVVLTAGEQRQGVELALTRGVRITGRVNAPNLTVTAYNLDGTRHAPATSDGGGNYTLLVAPGNFRIAASDASLTYAALFYSDKTDFRFAQTLSVASDVDGIDITLPRGGRLSGRVSDSGTALSGITVAAYDAAEMQAGTGITNAEGRYTIVVAPGAYRFAAFDTQLHYATSYSGGAVTYETTIPLTIEAEVTSSADFTMRRGMRVTGTVRTDEGQALTGIEVFAVDAAGHRVAGGAAREGAFTIVLPPGTYRFNVVDIFHRYGTAAPWPEVTVVEGKSPPPISLVVRSYTRRRTVRH